MATTPNLKISSNNNGNEKNGGGGDNNESSSSGNEMTAEWIVKAQLTIKKPKKKALSFNASDCGARRSKGSPCRVIYKWSSDAKDSSQQQQQNLTDINTEKVSLKEIGFVQSSFSPSSSHRFTHLRK